MVLLRRYKEILYGLLLGVAMWVTDAAMHAQLGAELHSTGLANELFHPGTTQVLFRSVFVVISLILGWSLWHSNWRERELRALEDAIVAFHRQLDSPAMRIVSNIRMLQGRPSVTRDDIARSIAESIGDDAYTIDQLTQQYLHFNEQVMAGRTREAIETLRAIESWASKRSTSQPPPTS